MGLSALLGINSDSMGCVLDKMSLLCSSKGCGSVFLRRGRPAGAADTELCRLEEKLLSAGFGMRNRVRREGLGLRNCVVWMGNYYLLILG